MYSYLAFLQFFLLLLLFFYFPTTKLMQLSDMEETSPVYIYFKPVRKS